MHLGIIHLTDNKVNQIYKAKKGNHFLFLMQQVLSKGEEISIFYTTLGKNFYVEYKFYDPIPPI